MNYKNIYDCLISEAQKRQSVKGYFEIHHIVPRSLGGTDDKVNLVKLTAREHFIAHCLLARIYGGTQWYAVIKMTGQTPYMNARLYQIARENYSKVLKGNSYASANKGKPKSAEHTAKMIASLKGIVRPHMIGNKFNKGLKGEKNPMYGKTGSKHPSYGIKRPEHSEWLKKYWADKKLERSVNV